MMKKTKINSRNTVHTALMLLALATPAHAATVVLDWDPSIDADVTGYKVYYQAGSAAVPFGGTGAAEGSAPIDVAYTTTATINGLDPAYPYFFAVTAYNSAGEESVYSNVVEVPESMPPLVSITSPAAGASATGVVSVSAAASDNVAVKEVQFYVNGLLHSAVSAAPYTCTWDTSALTPGTYTISAKATDAAGNIGESASVALIIAGDIVAPRVAVTSPTEGSTLSGGVTVTAGATDDVGVTRVEVYDNGALALVSNDNTASYYWDTTLAANGGHILTAIAYDAAGNVSQATGVTVTVLNDSTAPAVTLAPLRTGTVGGVVSVSAAASDDVGVSRVEFYLNGALQGTSTTAPYGFYWDTASVANGPYTLSAKAYDAAGNVGQAADMAVTVLNDTTAPTVAFTDPTSQYVYGNNVQISSYATDNTAVARLELYIDGSLKLSTDQSSINIGWNFTKGVHTVAVKAYDTANNVQTATRKLYRFN